jgi:hypothetical protein
LLPGNNCFYIGQQPGNKNSQKTANRQQKEEEKNALKQRKTSI